MLKDAAFNPPTVVMGKSDYQWELKVWSRSLTLQNSKKEFVTATYKRPYLLNNRTLEVITVQSKAWNDTVGMHLNVYM